MEITYDATGNKLTKNNSIGEVKNYVAGIEYNGNNLEAIYHSEGRLTPNASTYRYEYTLKDHLGSSRVFFSDTNSDNVADILQENHYYPFGMDLESNYFAGQVGVEGGYKYNGKELNEDFGLNWYDYGARWYDPAIGRWGQVDKLAEAYPEWSPYNYALNNPISLTDPDGNCPTCIVGFIVGAAVDYAFQVGANLAQGKNLQQSLTQVDGGSIVISGIADAVTQGLSVTQTVARNGAKQALASFTKNAAIDTGESIAKQVASGDGVSVEKTVSDVTAGAVASKLIDIKNPINTKGAERQLDRATRVAANDPKSSGRAANVSEARSNLNNQNRLNTAVRETPKAAGTDALQNTSDGVRNAPNNTPKGALYNPNSISPPQDNTRVVIIRQ